MVTAKELDERGGGRGRGPGRTPTNTTAAPAGTSGGGGRGSRTVTPHDVVAAVVDPELPVLTIDDLGVLRDVAVAGDGAVDVTVTPTYSGCPAMETIRADIERALQAAGYAQVRVHTALRPAWSTDWLSEGARRKLAEFGIAPPGPAHGPVPVALGVRCPQCGSLRTRLTSRFGSTACKALYVCRACAEPFDAMKAV
ncbi:MAG: phenylacetate-CoA oxygenase subunit PaaJ [Streptosporangiales bacterium]|nr:phenylacetate-CoA oxygenase subunit PaaJ [Streptosporangiales bacterium]